MKIKKLLSLFLALVLVFSCAGGWSVQAEEAEDPALAPTLSETAPSETTEAAPLETIHTEELSFLRYIDEGQFYSANHVARLSEEERLDTYVFLNRDGTKSVYYMGRDVKFVDTDGTVKDKDTTLIATDGGYTMRQNDVGILLPEDPTTGVLVVSGSHGLRLVPQGGSGTGVLSDNAVLYEDFYGAGMSLKYTPLLSGVKEDIILESYSGVHSFAFALQATGLSLYERDGTWCLALSETADAVFTLGEILVYDAVGKPTLGTLAVQEIRAGVYTLTVSAPVEFLTDPTTVYPVTIDPTITSRDTMTAANIEDATVFSGYPNNNFGNYVFNTIGYQDATYGTGRVAVRLKALLADETYAGLSADNITSVKFYMKDGGSNYSRVDIHPLGGYPGWTESTVAWSIVASSMQSEIVSYATMGGGAWTAFDITNLVKAWKAGTYSGACGFIMKLSDETRKVGALSCEYGSGDYWPYVKVTYEDDSVLNRTVVDIDEGTTVTLTVENPDNLPLTWTSDDTSIATVNSTTAGCVVTGVKAGTTTVHVSSADGSINAKCKVYVTVADGVYYIKNASSGLCLQGAAGSATIGAQRTDQETRLDQLWKITHVGSGYYVIRPMKDFAAALTVNNSTYVAVGDAAVDNNQVTIGSCWTITYNSYGYAFKRYGSNTQTVTPVVSGQPGSAVYAGTWDSSLGCHWELESAKGIFLRDTTTLEAITSSTSKFVVRGQSAIRAELGIRYEVYGSSQIPTWYPEDSTIAEVDSYTGKVTGVECDVTDIMAKVTIDNITYSQSYQLCVMAIPEGTYYLRNKQTRYYADFDMFDIQADATVYQYAFHGEDSQRWVFSYLDNGYYSIQSAYQGTSYYLGVENDSPNIRARIVLRDGSLSDGMKWKIDITESGAYRLVAKSCNLNYYVLNVKATMPVDNVELLQDTYFSDDNYQDEWEVLPFLTFGMSTENSTEGCGNGERQSYSYALAFYDALDLTSGELQKMKIHNYNVGSARFASQADFEENGAISNDVDFMIYIGHGHAAHDSRGNHLHYDCAALNSPHIFNDVTEQYTYCSDVSNFYHKNARFGSSESSLRWVWLYTCNFLTTGDYATENELKAMMSGAHIVLGYASAAYLSADIVNYFATELNKGRSIINAFKDAGTYVESLQADTPHTQRILYIPEALEETIYSPSVYYDYETADVLILDNTFPGLDVWS